MPPGCTPEHAAGERIPARAGVGNLLPRAPVDASGKGLDENHVRPPLRLRAGLRACAEGSAPLGAREQRRAPAPRPAASSRRPARFRGRAVGGDAGPAARRGRPALDPVDQRVRAAPVRRARRPSPPVPARGRGRGCQRRRLRAQARRRAGPPAAARHPGDAADLPGGGRRDRRARAGARGAHLRRAGGCARRARRARPRPAAHRRAQRAEARGHRAGRGEGSTAGGAARSGARSGGRQGDGAARPPGLGRADRRDAPSHSRRAG